MTINNALDNFKNLVFETSKKSKIKIYQEFIEILSNLEKRNLSETEIRSLETELDALDLNLTTTKSKRYFNKALKQLKGYLKDTLSLTTKGYYTHIGTALGSSFGVLFGLVFLSSSERSMGLSLGMMFGMFIGYTIGRNMDSQAEASGKMV